MTFRNWNTCKYDKVFERIGIYMNKKSKNKNRYKRISITSSSVATGILIFIKRRESRIEQISQLFKTSLGGIIERKVKRYSQKLCLSCVHVR